MKNLKICLFAATLSLLCMYATGQKELINSGSLLEQGTKLNDAGKYKEAIGLYKQISRSDTNYRRALYELSLSTYNDSDYTASLQYARTGLQLFPEKKNEWYSLVANALDEVNKTDSALVYYDMILQANPYDYVAWFNKGVTVYRKDKLDEAKTYFEKTILIYPYYASAHYYLGQISLQQGNVVPALMSFTTCLLVNPSTGKLNSTIAGLTSIANVKDNVVKYTNAKKSTNDDQFDMLQEIVLSKIALDKQYKLQSSLEDPITRQLQVMMEKLEYNNADKGFWMQYYAPLFRQVFTDGDFDVMVNYMFGGLNIKAVQEFNKKNSKQVDAFIDKLRVYFDEIAQSEIADATERKTVKKHYLIENRAVSGTGEWSGGGKTLKLVGEWEFYHPNGQLKSKGMLTQNEEKDGHWMFYNDGGGQDVDATYKTGKLEGKRLEWFDNGLLFSEENYKNDELEGLRKQYYYNGMLRYAETYLQGKKNGKTEAYTTTGNPDYTAIYKDDELDGEVKNLYADGSTLSTLSYAAGKANGTYKKYDKHGVLIMQGDYVNDNANGQWKEYSSTGKVSKSYSYTNGKLDGEYLEYFDNGQLSQKLIYTKGELDGKEEDYDEDGKLYRNITFEKGRIREVVFYDKTGKTISSATTRRGAGNLVFFDAGSNKESEGFFTKDGLRDGKTTYYFSNGKTSAVANFKDGLLQGEKTIFSTDGTVIEKVNYKDDKEDGYYTSYYENGKTKSEGWYVNGEKQGTHVDYDLLGNIISGKYYLNDLESGYSEHYYPDGKMDYEQHFYSDWIKNYKQLDSTNKEVYDLTLEKGAGKLLFKHNNGKDYILGNYKNYYINGRYEIFFFDGTTSSLQFYKNGSIDSIFKQYYYGGKLQTEGSYKRGEKVGDWKYYFSNGQLNYSEHYDDGVENGKEKIYNEDGSLLKEYNYKDDQLEGDYILYGDSNEVATIINYHKGEPVSYTYLDKDGKPVAAIPLKNGAGALTAYYKNGIKSVEMTFEEGVVNGSRTLWFTNGKTYMEGAVINGVDNGIKKTYCTDGQLIKEENNIYGNEHGTTKDYYKNGILKAEFNWYNGDLNGLCKYYDEGGKLTKTYLYYFGVLQNAK